MLKAPSSAFKFKNLLKHSFKQARTYGKHRHIIDMKFGRKLKDHIRDEHVGLAKVHKALLAFSMIVKPPQPLCSVCVLSTPGGPGLGPGSPLRRSRSRRLDPGGGQLGGERGQETSCRTQGGHTTARTPGTPPPGAGAGTIT